VSVAAPAPTDRRRVLIRDREARIARDWSAP
jgi:hypothetical protein